MARVIALWPQGMAAPPELSDKALLAACRANDSEALAQLFDRHHETVLRVAGRLLSGAPRPDIEDLMQTTFVEVWKKAKRYRGKSSVRSWILGIATNLARHYWRSEGRRRGAYDELAMTSVDKVALANIENRDLVRKVAQALPRLSPVLREAFVLCDLEDTPAVDAAKILGVREGTMWRRVHDARKALRRYLEES